MFSFLSTGLTFDTIYDAANKPYSPGEPYNSYRGKKYSLGNLYLGAFGGHNGPDENNPDSLYKEKELVFRVPEFMDGEKFVSEKSYIVKKEQNGSGNLIVYDTDGFSEPVKVADLFTENTSGGKKRSRKTKRKKNIKRKSKKRR